MYKLEEAIVMFFIACGVCFGIAGWVSNSEQNAIDELRKQESLAANKQTTTVIDLCEYIESRVDRKIKVYYESRKHPEWIEADTKIEIPRHDEIHYLDLIDELVQQLEIEMDTEIRWQWIERDKKKGIEIGTKGALSRHKVRIVYQVNDLSFVVTNFKNAPEVNLDNALNQSEGAGGSIGGIFDTPEKQDTEKPEIEQITDLITEFVEPGDWTRNGGDFATIRRWKNGLIIIAPKYIHDQLDTRR